MMALEKRTPAVGTAGVTSNGSVEGFDQEQSYHRGAQRSTKFIAALHREVARRYAWAARQRREREGGKLRPTSFASIRVRELEAVIRHQHGMVLPDSNIGRARAFEVLHHLARTAQPDRQMMGWRIRRASPASPPTSSASVPARGWSRRSGRAAAPSRPWKTGCAAWASSCRTG